MPDEPFMLVSLQEDKAKKLSHVLGNKTATKILEYLAGKDATETQISKKLKIPLSTVHYNMKQLVEAKLVVSDEFHYSEKGKEVSHYKLANKYIIIAPTDDESVLQKLKKFLPAGIVLVGAAAIIHALRWFMPQAADRSMKLSGVAAEAAFDTAEMAFAAEPVVALPWWHSPVVDWMLLGALLMLITLIVLKMTIRK